MPQAPAHSLILALYQPDIPQNTGTMLRTCACFGVDAAIVAPAGFDTSSRAFRRAGMDYLDHVRVERHDSFAHFLAWKQSTRRRLVLLSARAETIHSDFSFRPDDILMAGRESAGAPEAVHLACDARIKIPIRQGMRSLNVAVAASIAMAEALRQIGSWMQTDAQ